MAATPSRSQRFSSYLAKGFISLTGSSSSIVASSSAGGSGKDSPPGSASEDQSGSGGGGGGGGEDAFFSSRNSVSELSDSVSEGTQDGGGASKPSFFTRVSNAISEKTTTSPLDIDEGMSHLYMDPDILEKRCILAAKGLTLEDEEREGEEGSRASLSLSTSFSLTLVPNKEKTPESVVSSLPEDFFRQDFDPVVGLIEEVATWTSSTSSSTKLTELFMARIEETDTDKDMVMNQLATMVEANYADLMECVRDVQAIDVDLDRADLQVTSSRRKISTASEMLLNGPMKITAVHAKRERMLLLVDLAKSLQNIKSIHKTMLTNIVTGDLGRAAECAYSVLDSLRNDSYDRFVALSGTAASVQNSVCVIRQKTDKALMRLSCRKFAASDYANIIKGYLVMDNMAESLGIELVDSSEMAMANTPSILIDSYGCMEGLADRVQRFQLEDMDACLRTAVLEFIYASQHYRHKMAKELHGANHFPLMSFGHDMLDLEDQPLSSLYQKVSQEMLVPCIVRSCELLADVIHTNYLITQWHCSPFDERNENVKYLHRCPIDLSDTIASSSITSHVLFDDNEEGKEGDAATDAAAKDSKEKSGEESSKAVDGENKDDGNVKAKQGAEAEEEEEEEEGDNDDDDDSLTEEMGIDPSVAVAVALTSRPSSSSSLLSGNDNDFASAESRDREAAAALPLHQQQQLQQQQHLSTLKARNNSSSIRIKDETRSAIIESFEANFDCATSRRKALISSSDAALQQQQKLNNAAEGNGESEAEARMRRLQGARLIMAYQNLVSCRAMLWDELLRALVECLDVVNLTSAVTLDDFLDMTWAIDAMTKLGKEFCGSECKLLMQCLRNKSKEYFQHLHRESFQVLRQMVEAETWRSVPINLEDMGGILGIIKKSIPKRTEGGIGKPRLGLQDMVGMGLGLLGGSPSSPSNKRRGSSTKGSTDSSSAASSTGGDEAATPTSMLMLFGTYGNPLHFMTEINVDQDDEEDGDEEDEEEEGEEDKTTGTPIKETQVDICAGEDKENSLANDFLTALLDEDVSVRRKDNQANAMVVTQSSLNGLARCAGRYLQMMHLMSTASADIFAGLSQLFDLYLCNVFNGFVPSSGSYDERGKFLAKANKMTAPAPDQSKDYEALQLYLERALNEVITHFVSSSALQTANKNGGSGEDGTSSSLSTSSTGDVFIPGGGVHSSPLVCESVRVSSLLRVPQVVNEGDHHSNHFSLNARIVAAESCWFAARILIEIKPKIERLLPERCIASCEAYVSQFQLVASELRALVYRSMCPQILNAALVTAQIVDVGGWDTKKLRNTDLWVDKLVASCREVWEFMSNSDEFADSSALVREQVWLELCQTSFDITIDGFAKAKRVSPEGRAAMLRDVLALQEGLDRVHPCRSPRGLLHVEAYLRAASLGEEEMMAWIGENWQAYAYRHMYGLVLQTFSSMMDLSSKRLKQATAVLDKLYEVEEKETKDAVYSNLLTQRLVGEESSSSSSSSSNSNSSSSTSKIAAMRGSMANFESSISASMSSMLSKATKATNSLSFGGGGGGEK